MSSDNDGTTLRCSNGHDVDRGDLFCPVCGSPVVGQSDTEPSGEDPSEETGAPTEGPQRWWITAIGTTAVIALVLVILIAVTSSGPSSKQSHRASHSSETVYSASQQCADNAKVWVAKALGDLSAGIDPSQDLVSAVTEFGTQSQIYQAIIDGYTKSSTVVYQQGVIAAAKQAGTIIDSDCLNSGSSSGHSSDSGSGGSTATTDTTTIPARKPSGQTVFAQDRDFFDYSHLQGLSGDTIKDLEDSITRNFAGGTIPGSGVLTASDWEDYAQISNLVTTCQGVGGSNQVKPGREFACDVSGPNLAPNAYYPVSSFHYFVAISDPKHFAPEASGVEITKSCGYIPVRLLKFAGCL